MNYEHTFCARLFHHFVQRAGEFGHAAVVRLFDHAPRAILAGHLPDV